MHVGKDTVSETEISVLSLLNQVSLKFSVSMLHMIFGQSKGPRRYILRPQKLDS